MPHPPSPPDWMAPTGKPWRALSQTPVYENPWIGLQEFQAEAPTGARTVYGVVRFKNLAIGVLPIFPDGRIVLVGQHRFPLGDYSWEIPEGGAPLAGAPLEGARRELREETGLQAATWIQVLSFQLSNSVTDERGMGFIAIDLSQGAAEPDATESLAMVAVPFYEALEQALAGRIQDLITVAMLLRAYHMAHEGQLPEGLAKAMLGRDRETR
ncbi:MAG TPA: NUDIX hydrolase [Caulobacteraceae bacterium]